VQKGRRLARKLGRARLVAWNVRWFPDGGPGKRASENPTDIEWLACAMAYLNADVFALQEIKAYPRARQKLDEVRKRLGGHQQAEFRARLDDCEPEAAQHVGLLWNADQVRAEKFEVFAELNPLAGPCQNQLRPGLGARFRFAGGLDLEIVAAHLKSGGEPRSRSLRERSAARLPGLLAAVERRHLDDDLVVLGDFNVMGCKTCTPAIDGDAERDALAEQLGRGPKPLSLLPTAPACSHYFSGKASLLDLVVATRAMKELGGAPQVVSSGLCAELACGSLPEPAPEAYRQLSDHCPIVIDLHDEDLD
jgi:endonuclease/exonuclease/phosphatase family metal-dependent hydrolase